MSRKKELMLIIDTETANDVTQPIPYDIGYAICDRQGKIYIKRSFVVADIFLDYKGEPLLETSYYHEKFPQYWKDIIKGKRELKSMFNIRKQIKEDIEYYNVKKIGAYNMGFDKRALNNLLRYVTKSKYRWFFPYGLEYFCIWSCACQTILNTRKYIKFAFENNLISEAGNVSTSAESCYKFLTNQPLFEEEHTGLEDVQIEIEILKKCFDTHLKMNKKINPNCWKIPQKKRKKYQEKLLTN